MPRLDCPSASAEALVGPQTRIKPAASLKPMNLPKDKGEAFPLNVAVSKLGLQFPRVPARPAWDPERDS